MGNRTNPYAVNRRGLVSRYAQLRGIPYARADHITRDWNRSDFREVVEAIERDETPYPGSRRKARNELTTTVSGYVSMVDGITR